MNVTFYCTDGSQATNPAGTYWYRSNNAVSMVGNGWGGIYVTGQYVGQTYIEAWYGDIYARARVTVEAGPTLSTIVVTPGSWTMPVGDGQAFSAKAYDQYGNVMTGVSFTWTSSNTAAATVRSDGYVAAIGVGSTTVTASAGGKQGTSSVTVRQRDLRVDVTGWTDVRPGPGCVLTYIAHVNDGSPQSYAWESSGTIVGDYGDFINVYFTQEGANWVKVTVQDASGAVVEGLLDGIQVSPSGMDCQGHPPY